MLDLTWQYSMLAEVATHKEVGASATPAVAMLLDHVNCCFCMPPWQSFQVTIHGVMHP